MEGVQDGSLQGVFSKFITEPLEGHQVFLFSCSPDGMMQFTGSCYSTQVGGRVQRTLY